MNFVETLAQHPLVAVVRGDDPDAVYAAAHVLIRSGVRAIEITFSVPSAEDVIRRLVDDAADALIGAGTVLTETQVEASVEAGASFLVSPGVSPRLLQLMIGSGIPSIPGTYSPSEVFTAHQAGAAAIKLFPAAGLGPGFLRQIQAPMPGLAIMPSGGISADEAPAWLAQGAVSVGLGSLATPSDIGGGDWAAIQSKAERAVAMVRESAHEH